MRTSNSLKILIAGLLAGTALTGCRIEKPATVVPPPPSVESFTASAREVAIGSPVTLSWKTSNATSIELREAAGGALAVPVDTLEGSFVVTLDAASLFVLVARGPGGSDARAISVAPSGQVVGELSFSALPPIIPGGGSTTLAWIAPGAAQVSLTAGAQAVDIGGQRTSGAVTVAPKFDTTYTLTADAQTRTITVTVQPALLTAEATPRAAEVGDTVTLRWTAAGADSVTVSAAGRGQLFEATTPSEIASGTFADTVPPTPNDGVITYEIAAVKGTDRFTRLLEVNIGTGLAITRFDAPRFSAAGASYSVRWETRAADLVELKLDGVTVHQTASRQTAGVGIFAFNSPTSDFTVELIATNSRGGRVSQLAQIDSVGVPTSATLTANPSTVAVGQPITLTFASQEARRVRITDSAGQAVFSVTGQAAESGTAIVYPDVSTTYSLSADNLLGNPAVTATVAVTVTGTPAAVTQFPPTAITGQNVELTTAATGALLYGFPHNQVLASAQADFRDISGTGSRVLETGSDVTSVDLPFSTFLYGQRRSGPLTISRAGWLAWGAPLVVLSANATTLPSTTGPAGMIAPFWDDLVLRANSGVYVEVVGDAPDQTLIVQWNNLQVGTATTTEATFQAQVHQRGMVSFQYRTMNLGTAPSFVAGVQDQTRGLGLQAPGTPASDSAVYFFSPVSPPAEVRVVKGSTWGGYLKQGNAYSLVSQQAAAFTIPTDIGLTELMFRTHEAVPNGQYLEVINRTSAALDMSGWELRAPNAPTFAVPMGFTLQPNVATVLGASTDPAENDDAGVSLSWAASGFFLSQDAGSFTIGTADAGSGFTYTGPADGGRGVGINVDPGPIVGTTGTPGLQACLATTPYGGQTPAQLGTPGADPGCGFGYSLQTIPSKFVDISDAGTALLNGVAATEEPFPIDLAPNVGDPAPVAFGVARPQVTMMGNGYLAWGTQSVSAWSNRSVASTSSNPGTVAVFWDDLDSLLPQSEMYWKRFAAGEDPATPQQHWVFQWKSFSYWLSSTPDDMNFEVKLFESGVIEYHYGSMVSGTSSNYATGTSATVWLENPAGTQALVISINQQLIRPNTAFRFVPR